MFVSLTIKVHEKKKIYNGKQSSSLDLKKIGTPPIESERKKEQTKACKGNPIESIPSSPYQI